LPPERAMEALARTSRATRAATGLLLLFLAAILAALAVTLASVSPEAKGVAAVAVTPFVLLDVFFIVGARRGKRWAFAGGAVLGAAGVLVRLAVSTQPGLEVGGGLPLPVTAAYVALGLAVAAVCSAAYLEPGRRVL
jgi:hypothetical protein